MPIFKCTVCGCLDNAAVAEGGFWGQERENVKCCECQTGKWHDIFPKETPEQKGYEPDPADNRFYAPKGGWK